MEVWKNIVGFPNYEVSDNGKVRNKRTGRILKQNFDRNKNLCVMLYNYNGHFARRVKMLVAQAFMDDYYDRCRIGFKNGDKTDVVVSNLEIE